MIQHMVSFSESQWWAANESQYTVVTHVILCEVESSQRYGGGGCPAVVHFFKVMSWGFFGMCIAFFVSLHLHKFSILLKQKKSNAASSLSQRDMSKVLLKFLQYVFMDKFLTGCFNVLVSLSRQQQHHALLIQGNLSK